MKIPNSKGTIVSLGSKKIQVIEDLATIEDKLENEVYEIDFFG